MNLSDSFFLCLDIGTNGVRGIAHHINTGNIDKSAIYSVDDTDIIFALKSVVDELEHQCGTHFDYAYITGNFGPSYFEMSSQNTVWNNEHKIVVADVRAQIAKITPTENFYPMHIVPLRYDTTNAHNIMTPIGFTDKQLTSVFGTIFYDCARMNEIGQILRRGHIQPIAFYDPHFVQNVALRTRGVPTMFVDMGAEFTTASIWTDRGPMWYMRFDTGGTDISRDIATQLNIRLHDADRIKRAVASMLPKEMDRFTPADTAYEFSRADINDIFAPHINDIINRITVSGASVISRYKPKKIILSGGGAEVENMPEFFENAFGLPTSNVRADATVRALATYVWKSEHVHRDAYMARRARIQNIGAKIKKLFYRGRKRRAQTIPVMPSTLSFNMARPETYTLFASGGISIIHVDIMDGFYVDNIAGGITELKNIRAHTNAHLHVHLMTESPSVWAASAIEAGADTVIVSTNTSGVRDALRIVRAAGKRVGIALNPDSPVTLLKSVLRDIDEVMVMTVNPGAAGQQFVNSCVKKIEILDATRKKYKLKFIISVDGGINAENAQKCWAAGADLLVSGSYLAHSNDFPLAVQSLLKQENK